METCRKHPTQLVLVLVLASTCCPGGLAWSLPSWADTVLEHGLSLVWRSTSSPSLRTPHYSLSGNLQHYASPYLYFPHPYSTQINTTVGDLIAAATLAANSPVTLTNLRQLNPGMDLGEDGAYSLAAGMALNVPGYPAIPPVPTTIAATDTQHLLSYAAAYHLTLVEFEASNPRANVMDFDKLTTLRVPSVPSTQPLPCPSGCHCVRPGETLADVAKLVGSSTSAMMAANPHILRQGGRLFVGQALLLPQNQPNSTLPATMAVHAWQSPYAAMLQCPGLPLTSSYLHKFAKANDVSLEELVHVAAKSRVLHMVTLEGRRVQGVQEVVKEEEEVEEVGEEVVEEEEVQVVEEEVEGAKIVEEEVEEQGDKGVVEEDEHVAPSDAAEEKVVVDDEGDEEEEEEEEEEGDDEEEDGEEGDDTAAGEVTMMEDFMHTNDADDVTSSEEEHADVEDEEDEEDEDSGVSANADEEEDEHEDGVSANAVEDQDDEEDEEEDEEDEEEDEDETVSLGFTEYPKPTKPVLPKPKTLLNVPTMPRRNLQGKSVYAPGRGRRLVNLGGDKKEMALPKLGDTLVVMPAKASSDQPVQEQPTRETELDTNKAKHKHNAVDDLMQWALSTAKSILPNSNAATKSSNHADALPAADVDEYDRYFMEDSSVGNSQEQGDEDDDEEVEEPWVPHGHHAAASAPSAEEAHDRFFSASTPMPTPVDALLGAHGCQTHAAGPPCSSTSGMDAFFQGEGGEDAMDNDEDDEEEEDEVVQLRLDEKALMASRQQQVVGATDAPGLLLEEEEEEDEEEA